MLGTNSSVTPIGFFQKYDPHTGSFLDDIACFVICLAVFVLWFLMNNWWKMGNILNFH